MPKPLLDGVRRYSTSICVRPSRSGRQTDRLSNWQKPAPKPSKRARFAKFASSFNERVRRESPPTKGYLGFEVDWEHRFGDDPNSPLYMQIHNGDAVLHLNGHAEADAPVCEVRIPVKGLDRYCKYLRAKDTGHEKPEVVDPRYEGRKTDMNIMDPSGNHLVFWSPSEFDS